MHFKQRRAGSLARLECRGHWEEGGECEKLGGWRVEGRQKPTRAQPLGGDIAKLDRASSLHVM